MAPLALVEVGEFVISQGKTYQVIFVDNKYGFNKYKLIDIDSGNIIIAHRHQIDKMVDPIDLESDFPLDGDAGMATASNPVGGDTYMITENEEEKEETPRPSTNCGTGRFLQVTASDLDNIAEERSSKNTKVQTKWGVKILRGNPFIYSYVAALPLLYNTMISLAINHIPPHLTTHF